MKKDIFEAWLEYEKVAMHFNELLIKLRTQALAGVVALSTVAGFIAKSTSSNSFNWGFLSCILIVITFAWIAIWLVDFQYYNKLLLGAVDEVMRIEELSKTKASLDKIALSTQIEKVERTGKPDNLPHRSACARLFQGRVLFYLITFIGLASASSVSAVEWVRSL